MFIITVGAYVHIVSPSKLRTGEGEEILMTRHPTQRVATVKISIGLPLLLLTVILLYFTRIPYVYPTLTFAVGLYTFSKGLYVYWANSLTTYYMTNQRVVKEYRFLSLVRREVPHRKVRGVQERQSLIETLVGLGNVIVASGGGRSLEVRMRNMERSEEFADAVRDLI
ncbi:PH domain-containing protein [Halolamina sp.]|uniref:PH domain-containing protein n=1 Tax=Halolamina sp. TaxID=1940283 RepID=UPI0035639DB4